MSGPVRSHWRKTLPVNPQSEKNPLVSVVIPMFNEAEAIRRCLESLFLQNYPQGRLDIVVADGCSTDGSSDAVLSLASGRSNLRLIPNPKQRTPAGLNAGIRASKGEIVIILGGHTRVKEDFVRLNVEAMARTGARCTGGTQINVGDNYIQRAIGIAMASPFGLASAPYRFSRREQYVDTVVYAAYRRELFDEVGFFDEDLFISEDAEMNWRIRKAGHKIFFTPKIISYYYPRKTISSLFRQLFRYGILRVNVMKKHADAIKWIHLVPVACILLAAALILLGQWKALILLLGFYVLAVLYYSFRGALKEGIHYLPVLPLLLSTIHLGWGTGFVVGLFKSQEPCPKPQKPSS
jgi:GT2 family glycosyltransferase